MKKILTSFLLMVMIVGCVQQGPTEAEKPEEPPVVEQPEKPVEQEKPEETKYVKKIDENKDWVIVEKTEVLDLYSTEEEKIFRKMLSDLVSTHSDDFTNWYNTIYTPNPEITLFSINIDSKDADTVNKYIKELYESKQTEVGHQYLSYKCFFNDSILSIVVKEGSFIPGSDWKGSKFVYNFDITNGNLISNTNLIDRYSLSIDDIKDKLLDFYASKGSTVSCDKAETEEEQNYCFTEPNHIKQDNLERYVLFVENNDLYFMGFLNNPLYFGNSIKIKIS
ncbi:lipoprotein [Dielma fastidiosa]|uniref:Deacetylase PdaC domain-containing protein n=1 Tax=Dielma fastidiosa TaxID=1034346 RepID=A0A318KQ29_9FIRM|nr:hypothetical protein [Dielma fastidiosa]PXX80074.1 hypothetical protein DES51_10478 [Dielma fastidiosa]